MDNRIGQLLFDTYAIGGKPKKLIVNDNLVSTSTPEAVKNLILSFLSENVSTVAAACPQVKAMLKVIDPKNGLPFRPTKGTPQGAGGIHRVLCVPGLLVL